MAVQLAPLGALPQIELADGTPSVGGLLFFYLQGSVNTKVNTYTDYTGLVANTNPIVLNALGMPATSIWFTEGVTYKAVYALAGDTDPPTSPIKTVEGLTGINDPGVASAVSQWVAGPAPTFIGTTSFSLVGDQTTEFHIGRRVKTTNSGGTIYSTISNSVFGAVTTVTVINDSGVLDSGLSAVEYGLLTATNPATPQLLRVMDGSAAAPSLKVGDEQQGLASLAANHVNIIGTSVGVASFTGLPGTPKFYVGSGGLTAVFGADSGATTLTNSTNKLCIVAVPHFTNAQAEIALAQLLSATAASTLALGGGASALNAVTRLSLYAAANTTTTTGTEIVRVSTSGMDVMSGIATGIMVQGTAQASTSGTSIDFTSLPTGIKSIVVSFVGVSTNGTDNILIQLGDSGGVETSGYLGSASRATTAVTAENPTTGFAAVIVNAAASVWHGAITLSLVNAATFTWTAAGMTGNSTAGQTCFVAMSKSLSAVLDRVRITTVSGVDTFDAGSINIQYLL